MPYEESTLFTQPTQPIEDLTEVTDAPEDVLSSVFSGQKSFGKIVGRKGAKVYEYSLFLNRPVVIGRHRTCDIIVDSPISSNRHCRIHGERSNGPEEILVVCEDTSSNGTFWNGHKIGKGNSVILSHGDTLEIKKGHYFTYLQTVATSNENGQSKELHIHSKYQITDKILGSGTFAQVRLAIRKDTKEQLAVKIMEKRNFSTIGSLGGGANYIHEINLLRAIDHANIVRVYDMFETDKHVCVFMPLVRGGDLFDYIMSKSRLCEEETKFITYQVLLALKYLHERNITHRDVKPENILMDSKDPFSRVLLTDFGMAKAVGQQSLMKTMCGTFQYIAPEIIQTNIGGDIIRFPGYSQAVDCWSLGVVVYAMMSGLLPFGNDENESVLFQHILSGYIDFSDPIWLQISTDAISFIKSLLMTNPFRRMSVEQAFEHPWIKPYEQHLATLYAKRVTDKPLSSETGGTAANDNGNCRMSVSDPSNTPGFSAGGDSSVKDTSIVTNAKQGSPLGSNTNENNAGILCPQNRRNFAEFSPPLQPARKTRRVDGPQLNI